MVSPLDQGSSDSAPDELVLMLTTANALLPDPVSGSLVDGVCTHLCGLLCLYWDMAVWLSTESFGDAF